jgi:plastocyanin
MVGALLALPLAACGDDSGDDDAATGTTKADEAVEPTSLDVTAVDYAFEDAPSSIPSGLVTVKLTNSGKVEHEVALVEIGDTPLEEFIPSFTPAIAEGGPFPAEAEHVAAPVEIGPGDTASATFTVAPGTYAMLCTLTGDASKPAGDDGEPAEGDPHMTKGMAQVIEVTDSGAALDLPDADGTITAKDYSFDPQVKAGDTTINFINDGPDEIHFASISEFPEGIDEAAATTAFKAFLTADENTPPPADAPEPEDVGFSGVFSSGLGSQFTVPGGFESGRTYVLACFISDRAGGPPHAIAHDMYKVFTVE